MSVEEYPLKFMLLSTCAPSLVSNPRVDKSRFLIMFRIFWRKSVVQPCSIMTWLYLGLWCMLNPLKILNLGSDVEILRGEDPLSKFNLNLRRGIQFKMVRVLIRLIWERWWIRDPIRVMMPLRFSFSFCYYGFLLSGWSMVSSWFIDCCIYYSIVFKLDR